MDPHPPGKIVVFAGPSLYGVDATDLVAADYRPPARMGDVYRLLATDVDTIALIDGVFHGEPSVWHRELLAAVDAGIRVFGASSMGALRAAELHRLGMEGHGIIFGWYRDGVVTRDDEVALQHGDADSGYRPLSEPLVNIRATLADAVESGALVEREAQELLDHAARLHYPQRSLAGLLDAPLCHHWPTSRREHLAVWLGDRRRDLKRQDAVSLLQYLAAERRGRGAASLAATPPGYRRVELSFRTVAGTSGAALLSQLDERPPELAEARRGVIASWVLASWAADAGVSCPAAVVLHRRNRWEERHDIRDVSTWLVRQGLLVSELEEHHRRDALCAWLREIGPRHFGVSSYFADWAERRGLALPQEARVELSEWPLDRGPSAFGYRCDVSVELLQFLQCTDRLSLLVGPWPARAT